jgi:hypothetical protein
VQRRMAAACAGMLVVLCAQAQERKLTLGAGLHYSSGDYGTSSTTRITSLAGTAQYETGPWLYKATIPYLEVSGAATVIPGIGRVRGGPAPTRTQSGFGDIVLSATYAAYYNRATTLGLDLTGKLKLPTADEAKGLGTGEPDFALLVDGYKSFDRVTGFGGLGFHMLGDSPAFPLRNVWSANLGASYKLDERDSVGVMLEGRDRVAPGGSEQRELTGFWTRRFERDWKAQAYMLIGLADGSPDWGAGLSFSRPF